MVTMLDQPDQIEAYRLLAIYNKLKLEVDNPTGPTWRHSPRKEALAVMGMRTNGSYTKENVLLMYVAWLHEHKPRVYAVLSLRA